MPHATTMWDFSWLLRRSGSEAEYADVPRVLDELAERGYDTVRIDAFPHWIAPDTRGATAEFITALPQPPGFMWGNHEPVVVSPRNALLEFLRGLAERGIKAGLSTWFTPDEEHRNEHIRTQGDLARVWDYTLTVIENAGLAETIRYVDLCNEWPGWSPGIGQSIFGTESEKQAHRAWTNEEVARIDSYQDALENVRSAHSLYPLTLSWFPRETNTLTPEDVMRLSTEQQDIADVHLWLSLVCPQFIKDTLYVDDYSANVANLTDHEKLVQLQMSGRLDVWLDELSGVMSRWSLWAKDRGLHLWTTEGWASIGWSPALVPGWDGWEYVKTVGSAAVRSAIEFGWEGICTSNFSQPHHDGMWNDVEWHRSLTSLIREG